MPTTFTSISSGDIVETTHITDAYNSINDLEDGSYFYVVSAAGTDDYVVTPNPAYSSYITGMTLHMMADVGNNGTATINVNSLGAKSIKKNGIYDLETGDITAGQIIKLIYDGTNFQLMGGSSSLISNAAGWRDDGSTVRLDDTSDSVVIGGTAAKGKFHVISADSTVSAANTAADDVIIEGTSSVGLSFLSYASGSCGIFFADPADDDVGKIVYNHSSNDLTITVNALASFKLSSTNLDLLNGVVGRLYTSGNTQYVGLSANASATGSYTLTFPTDAPASADQVLKFATDGTSVWDDYSGGGGGGVSAVGTPASNKLTYWASSSTIDDSTNELSTSDNVILLNGNGTITSNPSSAGTNEGWKLGLYSNTMALGVITTAIAYKAPYWHSFFVAALPANDDTIHNPDSNASVSIGGSSSAPEITTKSTSSLAFETKAVLFKCSSVAAITSTPSTSASVFTGWKAVFYGTSMCIGNTTRTLALRSPYWLSFFTGAAANDDSTTVPDSNAKISFGSSEIVTPAAMYLNATDGVVCGNKAALATSATSGFLYIPTCAGTPTGTPTSQTGKVALVYDTSNSLLYVYNGSWASI